jgi:hypothetical protein
LPSALETAGGVAFAVRRCGTCSLDRVGSRTQLVRGDVGDDSGLAGSVRGIPCSPTQVSGGAHGMTTRRPGLHHRDITAHPGARMLDRLTRPWVLRALRLEEVEDVFRTRCRPQSQQMVI